MGDQPGQSKMTKIFIGIGAFVFSSVFITIYIACVCKETEQRIRNEQQNEKKKSCQIGLMKMLTARTISRLFGQPRLVSSDLSKQHFNPALSVFYIIRMCKLLVGISFTWSVLENGWRKVKCVLAVDLKGSGK